MEGKKNLCAMIPAELHAKMRAERTLAVQIPAELFERLKDYLAAHNLKQKQFLVQLIENALDEDTEAE